MKRVMLECVNEDPGIFTKGEIYQVIDDPELPFFRTLDDQGKAIGIPRTTENFRLMTANKQPDELKKECLKMALSTPGLGSESQIISAADKYYKYLSE